jgi:post-segregation antitoxin (ccd killing protein)
VKPPRPQHTRQAPNAGEERAVWLEANREAILSYNKRVSERGLFSDGWRRF